MSRNRKPTFFERGLSGWLGGEVGVAKQGAQNSYDFECAVGFAPKRGVGLYHGIGAEHLHVFVGEFVVFTNGEKHVS